MIVYVCKLVEKEEIGPKSDGGFGQKRGVKRRRTEGGGRQREDK